MCQTRIDLSKPLRTTGGPPATTNAPSAIMSWRAMRRALFARRRRGGLSARAGGQSSRPAAARRPAGKSREHSLSPEHSRRRLGDLCRGGGCVRRRRRVRTRSGVQGSRGDDRLYDATRGYQCRAQAHAGRFDRNEFWRGRDSISESPGSRRPCAFPGERKYISLRWTQRRRPPPPTLACVTNVGACVATDLGDVEEFRREYLAWQEAARVHGEGAIAGTCSDGAKYFASFGLHVEAREAIDRALRAAREFKSRHAEECGHAKAALCYVCSGD